LDHLLSFVYVDHSETRHGDLVKQKSLIDCIIQLLYKPIIMMDFENISLHWVNRLGFLVRRELAERFKAEGHNVGPEEWAILLLLWRKDGLAPSVIADATIRDRTTVTRFLDAMEGKGLLVRKTNPSDRRRSQVELTGNGRALEAVLVPIAQALIEKTHAGLTEEEQQVLVTLLRKMTLNLSA
jgi:DNA-binding MarR family transcriptional regulator